MSKMHSLFLAAICAATPALAIDGWHLAASTTIESKTSTWDYIAFEASTKRLYLGHRKEGLQVFDPVTRRLFSANGIDANLSVVEQVDANTYKMVETLGTEAWVKVLAMDHAANRLYSMTAHGTSDASKKINTAVSPYYINTVFPNSFRVLTYSK